jgi:hypothetical protein
MTDKERRAGERVEGIVVLQLDESGRYGVTRDISDKGLLIATRSEMKPGDRLDVVLRTKDLQLKRKARVVRVEKSPPNEEWPFRVAMELDEPLPREVIDEGAKAATTFTRASDRPPSQRPPG